VRGSIHDQFGALCELEEMIEDDVMTYFGVICGLEQMVKYDIMKNFKCYVDWK
jgi:hypothetical protein